MPSDNQTTDILTRIQVEADTWSVEEPERVLWMEAKAEIKALRDLVREMYGPACIYEGAGCGEIGKAHHEVLARAVGAKNV